MRGIFIKKGHRTGKFLCPSDCGSETPEGEPSPLAEHPNPSEIHPDCVRAVFCGDCGALVEYSRAFPGEEKNRVED